MNNKNWNENRVMILLNIKNWNEYRVVQLKENWTGEWKQGNSKPLYENVVPSLKPGQESFRVTLWLITICPVEKIVAYIALFSGE